MFSAVCPPSVASSASGRSLAMTCSTKSGGDGLDVGGVGELGVGHDRRRVGVDQDHPEAFGPKYPAGLGTGVVELAGLADHDRTRANDQDRGDVGTPGHQSSRPFDGLRAHCD